MGASGWPLHCMHQIHIQMQNYHLLPGSPLGYCSLFFQFLAGEAVWPKPSA